MGAARALYTQHTQHTQHTRHIRRTQRHSPVHPQEISMTAIADAAPATGVKLDVRPLSGNIGSESRGPGM